MENVLFLRYESQQEAAHFFALSMRCASERQTPRHHTATARTKVDAERLRFYTDVLIVSFDGNRMIVVLAVAI